MIDFLTTNPTVLAGLCTILGGVALKVIEKWLGKAADERADRQDYRSEIKELNERIDKLEATNDVLRARLHTEQEQVAILRLALINAGIPIPKSS